MKPAACELPIPKFAARQAGRLLKRLDARISRAAKGRDPASIHDLRVAIRRLAACLRVFGSLFPAEPAKKIRRRLKEMMESASAVRDCDIALDLWTQAGLALDSPVRARLAAGRRQAERKLLAILERRRRSLDRWRARMEL